MCFKCSVAMHSWQLPPWTALIQNVCIITGSSFEEHFLVVKDETNQVNL